MIRNKLTTLNQMVNDLIGKYTKYRIDIHLDMESAKNIMRVDVVDTNTNNKVSLRSISGYETLLFNIGIKKALSQCGYNSLCSLLSIDESIDCLDEKNFQEELPKILQFARSNYELVILISQRDISHVADQNIRVYYDEKKRISRLAINKH